MSAKHAVADNLKRVRDRIAAAAGRARRTPQDVRLVVVTKGVPLAAVRQVIELGEKDLGESRVQDLQQRRDELTAEIKNLDQERASMMAQMQDKSNILSEWSDSIFVAIDTVHK